MKTIKILIDGSSATVECSFPLTVGMVGLPVEFTFDETWSDLVRTVVFSAGDTTRDQVNITNNTTVPPEVMQKAWSQLNIGVYGTNSEGSIVIPTIWVSAGTIKPGADPSGDESTDTTLPVWQQVSSQAAKALEIAERVQASVDASGVGGTTAIYTTLTKPIKHSNVLCVNCHGLIPGENYSIHLYTVQRRRGNINKGWRHPSNEDTGEGFTGKGYYRLTTVAATASTFPPVPDWMPRGGILQTEWNFTAEAEKREYRINLGQMMLPMLKPQSPGEEFTIGEACHIIGIRRYAKSPLLMQFRVVRLSTGEIGDCKNTLRIGVPREKQIYVSTMTGIPDIPCDYLYKSII